MSYEEKVLISIEQLEANSVSNLNGLPSRLKFTNYTNAADFFKEQLKELSVKHNELFSFEDMGAADFLIFKVKSGASNIFSIVLNSDFDTGKPFTIQYKGSKYYFILKPRNNFSGYSIISFEGEQHPFNFEELVIDDFFKINLLESIYEAIGKAFIEFKPSSN